MLPREEFLETLSFYPKSKKIFEEKCRQIEEEGRLDVIYVNCYLCGKLGHISLDCNRYNGIKGNIKRMKTRFFDSDMKRADLQKEDGSRLFESSSEEEEVSLKLDKTISIDQKPFESEADHEEEKQRADCKLDYEKESFSGSSESSSSSSSSLDPSDSVPSNQSEKTTKSFKLKLKPVSATTI